MSDIPKENDDTGVADQPEHVESETAGEVDEAPTEVDEATVESLRSQLESANVRVEEAEAKALRVQAEMDNLRKRTERDVQNAHKFGVEKLLGELLPVIDSMELGLNAATQEATDVASTREGMELTLRMLRGVLEKFGIDAVDPEGEAFNPDVHQAISMQPVEGTPANTVLTVVQKGYVLNGRLVRPAMVVVAR